MQSPMNPGQLRAEAPQWQRQRDAQRTSNLLLLALSSAWLVMCIVLLVLLLPATTIEGLVLRCTFAVVPLTLLWTLFSAGQGKKFGLMAVLLVILITTDLSLRNRAYSDTSVDAQTLAKTALWGMGLLVALLNWRTLMVALREPAVALLVGLCLWFVVTSSYSPIRAYSFGASIAMLSVVLFGALARQAIPDRMILIGSIAAVSALLCLSLVLYVVAPGIAMASQEAGQVLRLAAPFGTPNSLGRAASLVFLLCTIGVMSKELRWTSPLVLLAGAAALACLLLSQSRTAAVALLGAIGLVVLMKRPARMLAAVIVIVLFTLVLMFVNLNLTELAAWAARSGKPSDVATLTGRTAIWSFVWGEIEKSPWLGYGYASTRNLIPLLYRTFWGWTATHAHNMWLQTWFVSGIVGLALLFSVFVAQLRYCLQSRDVASFALMGFVFVMGMTEAGHLDGAPSILTVLWAVFLAGRRALQPVEAPANARGTRLGRHGRALPVPRREAPMQP